jgi:hypothetical protein
MPETQEAAAGLHAQVKDRAIVAERMKKHVQAADATPLLIFPEGTCVNNEYCVMFKRGAFDLGATVCPIAIKYNKIFVDAFWNSKRQSFTAHLVSPAWSSRVSPLASALLPGPISFLAAESSCTVPTALSEQANCRSKKYLLP